MMSNNQPVVCIVLPTYNEAKNCQKIIPDIFMQQEKISTHKIEVLVVDSDSPDGTRDIVMDMKKKQPFLHIITVKERGLGRAYIAGFDYVIKNLNPELIFEMDADGQHDPKMIPIFIQMMGYEFDCIIGSRFVSGSQLVNFSFRRTLISKFGNWLIRVFGGIPRIWDCTSGYRCIRASFIKQCSFDRLLTGGYSFQSSLLSELVNLKARIMEFPIIFNERLNGVSKLRIVDQITFLFNLFFIRFHQSKQVIKYMIIGGLGIVVNLLSYILLTRVVGIQLDYAILVAIEISVIANFVGHHYWTFKHRKTEEKPILIRFFQYHVSVLLSLAVNLLCFYVLIKFMGVWDIMANFIGIVFGFFINYGFNSSISWRRLEV